MLDVAILTCQKLLHPNPHSFYSSQVIYEESLILDYLLRHGVTAERVDWADNTIDWSEVGCAVFRSPWDYLEKFDEFEAWLELAKSKTRFINSYELIPWNLTKHYLHDLDKQGIPIVPTVFLKQGEDFHLNNLFSHFSCEELVVKPVISAGGYETYRIRQSDISWFNPKLRELLGKQEFMVQPFQASILSLGEYSFIVIDGVYTHGTQKQAKEGEFRIQDGYGGYALPYFADDKEKEFSERVAKACLSYAHFARIDVVYDDAETMRVMEVEVFDPELFFRFDRAAAEKLADVIMKNL